MIKDENLLQILQITMKTSVEISHDTYMTDNISWVTATHAPGYAISHGSGRP